MMLPDRCSGKYWFEDNDLPIEKQKILGIEADEQQNKWFIRADRRVKIKSSNGDVSELYLEEGMLFPIGIDGNKAFLLVEASSDDRRIFKKFVVRDNSELSIGSDKNNAIVINSRFVSGNTALLKFSDGEWSISVISDKNGIYVNNFRINDKTKLFPGDVIYIIGVKIIIGSNFIALNNPDRILSLNSSDIKAYVKKDYMDDEEYVETENDNFYRSPRLKREITELHLQVDSPTQQVKEDENPILLTLAPAMIMGVASFSTGMLTFINAKNSGRGIASSIPTLIMSISMLLGMILFPFIMKKRDKKMKKLKEKERQQKYLKYIKNLKTEINNNRIIQEEILRDSNVEIVEMASKKDFWERNLWSKSLDHSDFLSVRLGLGNEKMYADIKFPEDRFSIDDDILRNEVFAFQKEERLLMNVPVCFSLIKNRVVGIVGNNNGIFNLLNNMLMQIFLLHGYDEVKTVFLSEKKDIDRLPYIRCVQHVWDDENKKRYLAQNEEEVRELSINLGAVVQEYKENKGDNIKRTHYIIISTSRYLANKAAFLDDVLNSDSLNDFSVVFAYDEMKNLPKECSAIIEVNERQGIIYERDGESGRKNSFVQDIVNVTQASELIKKMSEKHLDLNRGRYELPGMLTFLDMFKVGRIEYLNVRQRWIENNPVKTLQTPVGVDTNGETFYLDLHEKAHGPHGLVAGMTGSGKSEFIITFILSLAVNYHPDEVAFVLIDYKGGGLTGAFQNEKYCLPHLAGTITNLDGNAITRSILSIKSELRKRQAIFNQARAIANEGTMDIYKYQKMYRDKLVSEPMPHLFIISDEFAELKSQQPEFMEQLISTARIGRSLGVHLILATQKPSGVVNEQIWANSKFKVCLKVQDKSDSMEMLKKPDAASISETGRFFLQVGYNELFEKGQSAWAGAPYIDRETVNNDYDSNIEIIDNLGNVVDKLQAVKKDVKEANGKQIVRIMEYLDQIAKEDKISERQLWCPEIPENIYIEEICRKYLFAVEKDSLVAVIGEIDNPYEQSQEILTFDFKEKGNSLIYGVAGSGEDMMLTAILYSLFNYYDASKINAYILDFGAETLKMFENAPQTGCVIIDGEPEKMNSFANMLKKEFATRKKALVDYGGSIEKYNASVDKPFPYMLVIINNYAHFAESNDRYEEFINSMSRECPRYGIFFIITATSASSIRYRTTQNFQQVFCLQLNDKGDYSSVLGTTGGVYPPAIRGRGIFKRDKNTYVFQCAEPLSRNGDVVDTVRSFCAELARNSGDVCANKIKVIPKYLCANAVTDAFEGFERLPLGISLSNNEYIYRNIKNNPILLIASQTALDSARYTYGLIEMIAAARRNVRIVVINSFNEMDSMSDSDYETANDDFEKIVIELFEEGVKRFKDIKNNGNNATSNRAAILVVMNECGKIFSTLSEDGKDKMQNLLKNISPDWNMHFIISDDYKGISLYSSSLWYSEHVAGEGVWVGDGVADQIRFTIRKKTRELEKQVDETTGYLIEKNEAKLMRLIVPSWAEKELEYDE
ncbi:MAG: type VII secretion protein EssC [Lachnospiraceae bacterium]|nr:type VII secretion protein EssC [Lachnospiraceae bacterium]